MKKVGILGAGASGLCAARHCLDAGYEVKVFEQQEDVGGTWIQSPDPGSFSAIYDNLVANLPVQIMGFKHLEFKAEKSFVGHSEVLAFLRSYAESVRHLIQFNTIVTDVERDENQWKVTVKRQNNQIETFTFDVIFVCNGHYWNPRIPKNVEKLKIPWIHSYHYRRPDEFVGKNVAIVGAGPSGFDIATEICGVAKSLTILHNQRYALNGYPPNVNTSHHSFHDVEDDGKTLILRNGEKLTGLDVIIFCTGYKYTVPFFHSDIVEPKENGKYLSPLYLHMISIKFPTSLFFLGLPWFVIPFTCFDSQMEYAIGILNGTVELPVKEEMDQFEVDRLGLLKERGHQPEYFYRLAFNDQWEYLDSLDKVSKKPPVPIVIRKLFEFNLAKTIENVTTFRNYEYKIKNSEEFEFEKKC